MAICNNKNTPRASTYTPRRPSGTGKTIGFGSTSEPTDIGPLCDKLEALIACAAEEKALLASLISIVAAQPQLEGVSLIEYCNDDGETTGYAGVILDEVTGEPKPVFFDANYGDIAAAPEGKPCKFFKLLCKFPFTPEPLVKNERSVIYDNGVSAGSSTNNCGARQNFVSKNDEFEVIGMAINGTDYGAGTTLGPYNTRDDQLQGISGMINGFGVAGISAAAIFLPARKWRCVKITTCDPDIQFGELRLRRKKDGCEFTMFPICPETKKTKVFRYATLDCDEKKEFKFCDIKGNDVAAPEDLECYFNCNYPFSDIIAAESPCTTETITGICQKENEEPLIAVIDDCNGTKSINVYTLDSYLSATAPDQYVAYTGPIINCETGADVNLTECDLAGLTRICGDFIEVCDDASETGSFTHTTEDNTTDLTWSYNTTTLKIDKQETFNSSTAQTFLDTIKACIAAGGSATIDFTDPGGNTGQFIATAINTESDTQCTYSGSSTGGTQTGKIATATVNCSNGKKITVILTKEKNSTAILDKLCKIEENIIECPGSDETIPDADYNSGSAWVTGRPAGNVLWELIDNRDPANQVVVVSGANFTEFVANLEAAGYNEWSFGETHYICPCPPGLVSQGDYFTQAGGNTVTKMACTPLAELPGAPTKVLPEKKTGLSTLGCLDAQMLAKLCNIETLQTKIANLPYHTEKRCEVFENENCDIEEKKIYSPANLISVNFPPFNAGTPAVNHINKAGLNNPFVDGDDFATYTDNDTHTTTRNGNESYFSGSGPLVIVYDMGQIMTIQSAAIRNEEAHGPLNVSFEISTDNINREPLSTGALSNNPGGTGSYLPNIVEADCAKPGQYIRATYTGHSGNANIYALGEIAFGGVIGNPVGEVLYQEFLVEYSCTGVKYKNIDTGLPYLITNPANVRECAKEDLIYQQSQQAKLCEIAANTAANNAICEFYKFSGNQVQDFGLPAGTIGDIEWIKDSGTGLVYFSTDGSTPSNTAGQDRGEITGPYHSSILAENIDLSTFQMRGSSGNSDYTVKIKKYLP